MSYRLQHHRRTNIIGSAQYTPEDSGGIYESTLERDAFIHFMMEPGVLRVVLQPTTLNYEVNGKPGHYTPDLFVEFGPATGQKSCFVECKYKKDLTPEILAKHEMLHKLYSERREIFLVVTEDDIRVPTFSHRRFLLSFRDEPRDREVECKILRTIHEVGRITIGDLLRRLDDDPSRQLHIVPQVWRLAAWHQIELSTATVYGRKTMAQMGALSWARRGKANGARAVATDAEGDSAGMNGGPEK